MSWDTYVTDLKTPLNGEYPVAEVAIWGRQPGQESQWISTPGLSGITVEEIRALGGDRNAFFASGPVIAGKKCMFLHDSTKDEKVYSMSLKTKADANGESFPICVAETKLAYIILLGTKTANSGQLSTKVYGTVTHLRGLNY